jgi:hypothetical protein
MLEYPSVWRISSQASFQMCKEVNSCADSIHSEEWEDCWMDFLDVWYLRILYENLEAFLHVYC